MVKLEYARRLACACQTEWVLFSRLHNRCSFGFVYQFLEDFEDTFDLLHLESHPLTSLTDLNHHGIPAHSCRSFSRCLGTSSTTSLTSMRLPLFQ